MQAQEVAGERDPFPSRAQLSAALDPKRLCLLILPTEQCNFRCVYCYESFASGKMGPEVVQGIKRLIDRRVEDVSRLQVSWFGGEPLAAKDIVFDISEHAALRCRERGIEHIPGAMTTNGYLLSPDTMSRLSRANQRQFQISIDGLGAVHDRSRPLMSGKGSFERLWQNLAGLKEAGDDFHINLRLHYGICSEADTEALCREVNRHFGGDVRFSVYLKCIENYGGPNAGTIKAMPREEAKAASERFAKLMPDIPVSHMYEEGRREICYAACPNNLMIRADGRIGKCALSLGDERNTIGRLTADGRVHIENARLHPWMAGFADLDAERLICPYQSIERPHP